MSQNSVVRKTRFRSPLKSAPLRNPGQYLDGEIHQAVDDRVVPVFLVACCLWFVTLMEGFAVWRNVPRMPLVYAAMALAATVYCGYRVVRTKSMVARLKLGRDGEKAVGQFLEALREQGAKIFHDIQGNGFNLDHVVIGRHGVFVIETKTLMKPANDATIVCHDGQLLAAGRPFDRDPVRQVRAQVQWLMRTLEASTGRPFAVRGVLAFPGWFVDPSATHAHLDLWILEPKAFPAFMTREPVRLAAEDIALASFHLSRLIRTTAASA